MRTLAVVNQKGGSGKTVTAVNVAAAWARSGRDTLLVDLDAQASASLHLGLGRGELSPNVADVLFEGLSLSDSITSAGGLPLVPGHARLRDADELLGLPPHDLLNALSGVQSRFEAVVIDCPPALGMLTLNALQAADLAVVPTPADFLNVRGLGQVRGTLDRLEVPWRVLLTKLDRRTRLADEIGAQIRSAAGSRVLDAEVRVNVRLAEAPAAGESIFDYAPRSRGAHDYEAVAVELWEALNE